MSLTLKNVSKTFTQGPSVLKILENLFLTMPEGEVLAIIGESGSGKSTLLSLIAGFERPDSGDILWEENSTQPWSEDHWANFRKQSIGFVFQNYHLIPYLSARENVMLPLQLLKQKDFVNRSTALLTRLGLQERMDHLPNQLSGGERQRVAIARALIHRPKLLLADEPTGSLDAKTGLQVLEILFEILRDLRQTAIVVTHSPEVAARCDRSLRLNQGALCSIGN